MAIGSAPGVYRREIDISDILVAEGVSNGGTVVRARKGPVRRPVLVTNDKEYIEAFGEPYFKNGLDDTNPVERVIGGSRVPELGYGAYGAIQFLGESDSLYVVRAYDDGDKYAAVELTDYADRCNTCDAGNGVSVLGGIPDVFDTGERNSTYEYYYQNGNMSDSKLLVGFTGPGSDGNDYAVTVETINPEAEWLYSLDEYPSDTSATQAIYGFDVAPVWLTSNTTVYTSTGPITATDVSGCTVNSAPIITQLNGKLDYSTNTWTIYDASVNNAYPVFLNNAQVTTSALGGDNGNYGWWTVSLSGTGSSCSESYELSGYVSSADNVFAGGSTEVAKHFPIASEVIKLNVFKKSYKVDAGDTSWGELYANETDKNTYKIRLNPLETYFGTMTPFQDVDGNELFIEKIVNGNSDNIYVKANGKFNVKASWDYDTGVLDVPTGTDDSGFYFLNTDRNAYLGGGTATISTGLFGDDSEFWSYFENRDELPVQILLNPSFNQVDKAAVAKLVSSRRDLIAANQVGTLNEVTYQDILKAEGYGYPAPSYMALYAGYSRIYDTYNDKYVYLPNAIYGATLMARVDRIAQPWFAPAGTTRGTISVLDQNKIFSQDHIGRLYDRNINAVKYVSGTGFVMFGQKTAQLKKSALDRIQVRRALLYIQNNIEVSLNQFVFENNTTQTRLRVYSLLDEFLAGVKAQDGVYDYEVVCDDTNNPSSVIDANQLNVDVYIQPVKTIEYIKFTTVVTRTGVSFSDVKLKYA